MSSTSQTSMMDPEDLVECPFDKTHMIRAKRFQYHVTLCAKNFPNHNMKKCPFNARHWVESPHYQHHLSVCPDRRSIETETEYQNRLGSLKDGTYFGGNVSVPAYETQYAIDETESWDDDATAAPFILGGANEDHYKRNSGRVEPVFVHPAERGSIKDQEIRLPKHAPEVLQNKQRQLPVGAGYGRGALVAKTREEKQAEILQNMSRGRGLRSLSEVLGQSPLGPGRQPSPNLQNNLNQNTAQWNGYSGSANNSLARSESPYSSESESSVKVPALARKHAGTAAPRSVNANNNRFSPNLSSRENSPKPGFSNDSGDSPKVPGWLGRGRGGPGSVGSRGSSSGAPSPTTSVGRGTWSPSGPSNGGDVGTFKEPAPVVQMPTMRGIGRGTFRTVSIPIPGVTPINKGFDSTGSNSPCSQSDSDQFENEMEREKLKEERKLRKRIKQIESLEKRQEEGLQLSLQEKDKIITKSEVLTQLENLKLS